MRIAYLVIDVDNTSGGVNKKIHTQCTSWQQDGNEVQLFIRAKNKYKKHKTYLFWKRFNLFNPFFKLIIDLIHFNPDCIYMREENFSLFTIILFSIFHNKIVLEINSHYQKEANLSKYESFTNFRTYILNIIFFRLHYRFARGLIFVTKELSLFSEYNHAKNRYISPNSIRIKDITYKKCPTHTLPIKLFFLGSPNQKWHGVDKLFSLAISLGPEFEIHIIGALPEPLTTLIPHNIKIHRYSTSYDQIICDCHIAISTMALHRKGLDEACPLKTREYLAAGFPTILAYTDTAFNGVNPNFVLELENSENNVYNTKNIDKIKEFCHKYAMITIPQDDVLQYIDASYIEHKRIKAIRSWFNK